MSISINISVFVYPYSAHPQYIAHIFHLHFQFSKHRHHSQLLPPHNHQLLNLPVLCRDVRDMSCLIQPHVSVIVLKMQHKIAKAHKF